MASSVGEKPLAWTLGFPGAGWMLGGLPERLHPERSTKWKEYKAILLHMAQEIYSKVIAGGLLIGMEDGQTSGSNIGLWREKVRESVRF